MKNILIFIFSLFFFLSLFSQEIKESDLPANIKSSFKEQFSPQGKVAWTKSGKLFIAAFKADNINKKAAYTEDGNWLNTRDEINYKELPASITDYISANFKDAIIMESSYRETASENRHCYILLGKNGSPLRAELFFDLQGELISENIPEAFSAAVANITPQSTAATDAPQEIVNAFSKKFPSAKPTSWKITDSLFTAEFTLDGARCKAGFLKDGTWKSTRHDIPEKELPSPVIADLKQNFKNYKITASEIVQEPDVAVCYYLFAKIEGTGQPSVELYYSITGTRIKKKDYKPTAFKNPGEDTTSVSDDEYTPANMVEKLSIKELPSTVVPFIKKNFSGYAIKEAFLSTTERGYFYYVKIKKEGYKELKELTFDIKGICISPLKKEGEEEEEEE